MAEMRAPIPREAVAGSSYGVILMAFFSLMWSAWGVASLDGLGGWAPWPIVDVLSLALLAAGIFLLSRARRLRKATQEQQRAWSGTGRRFGMLFGTEGAFIGIAALICHAAGRSDLIPPAIALVVGLHFIPLARVFRRNLDYWAGALICLAALIGLFLLPDTVAISGYHIQARPAFVGLVTASILWFVGGHIFLHAVRALKPA